jgi:hypothetical protein
MNAVEIEQAVSELAEQPFDAAEFPFAFLAAFGNKDTTLKRLKSGNSNASDVPGGVLQRNNIHIAACAAGAVSATLQALRASPATAKAKAKFILATDGQTLEAEELASGDAIACDYPAFPNRFGFFLSLAGISTIIEIKDNPIDVRATGRLNKLYVELLRENPDWAASDRRHDMNHFMARLIFCFFAEDTDIFNGQGVFTRTIEQMSERDGSNTHAVLSEIFRAMNTVIAERVQAQPRLPGWADTFPYVNGGLFSGSTDAPRFTRIARAYLIQAGSLNWRQINPDIFGSMIQAIADDEERGALGMHYTSVPNILKVLNPLFLDDLRTQLGEAGDSKVKLLNLRKRIAHIRVFDPACGSGNFLVIAYKQMREIEDQINRHRGEIDRPSDISLKNFRGIELRDFPVEIARLALIIAEFQCDVLYRGPKLALAEFLPLDKENWIVCGNALRLDWLSICPPTGTGVKVTVDDSFETPLDQTEIDFDNEGGETYICGNPPYAGLSSQNDAQKDDLRNLLEGKTEYWRSLDYVMGWFWKAHCFMRGQATKVAFVTTNSICQGQLVPMFWPSLLNDGTQIYFAHTSFKWQNLAANNAGVIVAIIGLSARTHKTVKLYSQGVSGDVQQVEAQNINAYLVPGQNVYIEPEAKPVFDVPVMYWGNKPVDGGHLLMSSDEARRFVKNTPAATPYIRPFFGSQEFIDGNPRACVWVHDDEFEAANKIPELNRKFEKVREFRLASKAKETRPASKYPYKFRQIQGEPGSQSIIVPIHSSESRPYLPTGLLSGGSIISNAAFGMYDVPLWNMALIASRLHLVWIATVCGKLKTDFRYSNTLGWNTFPVPLLTEQNKTDLTTCAENILLAREAHFPATIADLYDPDAMPDNLRAAHARNDEVLERIYIGRKFRNDTERLEKLFDLYTKMTAEAKIKPATKMAARKKS